MKSFRGKVGITDKKYTVSYEVSINATNFNIASYRAVDSALRTYRKARSGRRTSIVSVHLDLKCVGEVEFATRSTASSAEGTTPQPYQQPPE